MAELLQNIFSIVGCPMAKYFVVPVISTVVGMMLKYSCMNDEMSKFNRDLFYWGPNLMATTLLIICVEYYSKMSLITDVKKQNDFSSNCINSLLLTFAVIYVVNLLIRKKGWDKEANQWSMWGGIILPNAICFLLMLFVMLILNP